MCTEYHIQVNMYYVSAQGVDERMINVHYYYYLIQCCSLPWGKGNAPLLHVIPNLLLQCCFTFTETVETIRDGEPRTSTSSFTQLQISVILNEPRQPFILVLFLFSISIKVVCLKSYLVVIWLVPRETAAVSSMFCVRHTKVHQFTVSLHAKPQSVHVPVAITCNLHLWQNDRDLLRVTTVTRGWNGCLKYESAQKADPGEENYSASPARTRTRDLSITSPAL